MNSDNKARDVAEFVALYQGDTRSGLRAMSPRVMGSYRDLQGTTVSAPGVAEALVRSMNPEHADALRGENPGALAGGRSRRRGRTTAKKGGSRRRRMTSKARCH
jgi:hypothetical protein